MISGRPVAFLAEQLGGGCRSAELVGLYGLERIGVPVASSGGRPGRRPLAGGRRAAAASRAEAAAPAGVQVERKGLAVTLHYRQAPELAGWAADFAAAQAARSGLVAHPGKMSWELRPPVPTDKGTVVAELAAGLAAVCFVGDDTGDLPGVRGPATGSPPAASRPWPWPWPGPRPRRGAGGRRPGRRRPCRGPGPARGPGRPAPA